jgi:hypothetical protein
VFLTRYHDTRTAGKTDRPASANKENAQN